MIDILLYFFFFILQWYITQTEIDQTIKKYVQSDKIHFKIIEVNTEFIFACQFKLAY